MKLFSFILLAVCYFASLHAKRCESITQEDCENLTSEYEKYRECMEHRTKRSVDCSDDYEDDSCDSCNCNTCSYSSCDKCSSDSCCSRCCPRSACTSYHCCHQLCRAECKSNTCRTSCRKKCQDRPSSQTVDSSSSTNQTISASNTLNHNITTVIHLNNLINNTNLISLPITVNNTVFNNITSMTKGGGGYVREIEKESGKDNCCITIGPRQCIQQKDFPFIRCYHLRKRVCGYICTAPVVHYQKHEICDNDVSTEQPCRQQVVYVPQPQPRCAYQPSWPYVSCGNQEFPSCEGCYNHYVRREDVTKCSNFCYDDGFGVGPYYRQGPFYRPGYAHAPSCIQTGTCNGFGNFEGYEDNPDYGAGFPYVYPPSTYQQFVIEDCPNCTDHNMMWDSVNQEDPIMHLSGVQPATKWSNDTYRMMGIEAEVDLPRSGRYAEIKIKTGKESEKIVSKEG